MTSDERLARAKRSLDGLSVGDAFGERFFVNPIHVEGLIAERAIAPAPWQFTDDTVMALSIVEILAERGAIDRDLLAARFGARYRLDRGRGYGGTAHGILERIALGEPWSEVAPSVFGGGGSMGNGGAMRSAPIGAYFFDDLARAASEARASADPTHAHPEGQAGAMAVAVAAAWVGSGRPDPRQLFEAVLAHTPAGATRAGIEKAASIPRDARVDVVARLLGNGSQVISADTVPFSLWCAARHLGRSPRGDYEEAMWTTVSGLGDRDTTCAIVGGILTACPETDIPSDWLEAREPLEAMSLG
jgi:ADP-ribosylglycohydrolase